MISLPHPRSPLGRVLVAATAAFWATLLIVAWAPDPSPENAVDAADGQPGNSSWLALVTVGVVVLAGSLHARRRRQRAR